MTLSIIPTSLVQSMADWQDSKQQEHHLQENSAMQIPV